MQPLSPIGGNITLNARGGINVHGTGQLEGLDLSGLGDAIVHNLIVTLDNRLKGYSSQRGY